MILACNHISKAFADETVLSDAVFHINEGERAAIVGINGAGKTTLLRIIVGELPADSGEIVTAKGSTIGYLPQQQGYHSDKTIYEELLAVKSDVIEMDEKIRAMEQQMTTLEGAELERVLNQYHKLQTAFEDGEGYTYKSKVLGVINGLGFRGEAMHQCINNLSGGQKTRVALSKLLLSEPDLLLMDEPTNHLDLESVRWLENYLNGYRGSVLVVSHDRFFIDRIAEKIIEIDHGKVITFTGDYTSYSEKKEKLREEMIHRYYNQQQEIKHQEAVIQKLKSFNREKSIRRAESREKMLAKIERVEKPVEYEKSLSLSLTPSVISGNDVLKVEGLAKAFPPLQLFQGIDFEVKRGERVALIGNNGTGKTTILKIINELLPPDAGTVTLGSNVHIGYYDQEHQQLHMEKTIFDEIADDYPNLNNTKVRNVLAAFLFTDDDVYKRIEDLSGGERGRVALAKLMLSDANFLILDEPTNHLDITSKEILEEALKSYTGTVLFVSHDRYFINQTATRILELTGETVVNYIGNYDYYLEKHDQMMSLYVKKPEAKKAFDETPVRETAQKVDWQTQKAEQARIRKIENSLKKTEERISELEGKIAEIDEECAKPEVAVNSVKLGELTKQQSEYREELDRQYEMWEELSLQLADTSGQ